MRRWLADEQRSRPCRWASSLPGGLRRACRVAAAFAGDRRAGAMLYTGVAALTLLTSVGAMMTNYAWREAQQEEVDAALRASVAAVGQLLDRFSDPDAQAATEALVRERVAQFLDGLLARVDVDKDDVTVSHDADSRVTRITVGGQAKAMFDKLFGDSTTEENTVKLPTRTVAVQLLTDRYEIAIAADLTASMTNTLRGADGRSWTGPRRIDALKSAAEVIEEVMRESNARDSGSLAVAVVPFGPAVNVADTSGAGDTPGKRRYARMLIGEDIDTNSARESTHHWVDAFHAYGTGANMGELQSRTLPNFYLGSEDADGNARSDWLTTADWNLRANEDIDVSSQAPMVGTTDNGEWAVNGVDFWNGCVMARWGAYWNAAARPSDWDGNNPAASNWPAQASVAAWTPESAALTNQPLHLSDAPPDYAQPNTRFTAYSWPDAHIALHADAHLHGVLVEMLDDAERGDTTTNTINAYTRTTIGKMAGFNDWTQRAERYGHDGSSQCPQQAIQPLTDSATTLSDTFDSLTVVPRHGGRATQTLLHLGVVWSLRALSPLWSGVWSTADADGNARPYPACASGETGSHCDPNLKKVIVLITDGYNYIAPPHRGRIGEKTSTTPNPSTNAGFNTYSATAACKRYNSFSDNYGTAMGDTSASAFNNRFGTFVDTTTGVFNADGIERLVDAFDLVMHADAANATDRDGMKAALNAISGLTPWRLFRGHGFLNSENSSHIIDHLMDHNAHFGFDGRPMHNDLICRRGLVFSPYGGPDDLVQVGARPVDGVAPFTRDADWTDTPLGTRNEQQEILDDWLKDACRLAGQRGVSIRVVFLNDAPADNARYRLLEQCIDSAGGTANVDDIFATPTQAELREALERIVRVVRRLRFLES